MKAILAATILTLGVLGAVSTVSANTPDGPAWVQEAFETKGD